MIIAGVMAGKCNALELDFDGSRTIAARPESMSNDAAAVPAVSAPLPAVTKGINEQLDYFGPIDSNSQMYMSEQAASAAGNTAADRFRVAGYSVLGVRTQQNPWGCLPTDYCSKGWVFWLKYAAPDGEITWRTQKYAFNRDCNANFYISEAALRSDAKIAEGKLSEAGYTVLQNTVKWIAPLTSGDSATWMSEIEYIAPVGSAPGDIQWLRYNKDQQGNWYSGPQGRMQVIAGGKAVADNLRAAGLIILQEFPFIFDLYDNKWEYDIRYISRIK